MKKISNTIQLMWAILLVFVTLGMSISPRVGLAQVTSNSNLGYVLLAPLPLPGLGAGQTFTLGQYLSGIYRLGIAMTGVLAVLMITVGGGEYMLSEVAGTKEQGKKRIQASFYGLFLAMSSYLILYTINPNLVSFNLNLKAIVIPKTPVVVTPPPSTPNPTPTPTPTPTPNKPTPTPTPTPNKPTPTPPPTTGAWDDSATRATLTQAGIPVKTPPCTAVGQAGCTSVYQLGSRAVNGLIKLKADCGCSFTVTAGTEYWLHGNRSTDITRSTTSHKPGNNTVDLRSEAAINRFISGKDTPTSGCFSKFHKNGVTYSWEGQGCKGSTSPHWHVLF